MTYFKINFSMILGIFLITTFLPIRSFAASHWPQNRSYDFVIIDPIIHIGKSVSVKFHVVHKTPYFFETIYRNVDDAIIIQPKLEQLNADGDWVAQGLAVITKDPDKTYIMTADLPTPGNWKLNLLAQMPGNQVPVEGKLEFQVVP